MKLRSFIQFVIVTPLVGVAILLFIQKPVAASYTCNNCPSGYYEASRGLASGCIPDGVPNDNDHVFIDLGYDLQLHYCPSDYQTWRSGGAFGTPVCIKFDGGGNEVTTGVLDRQEKDFSCNQSFECEVAGFGNTSCNCYHPGDKINNSEWCDPHGSGNRVNSPQSGTCGDGNCSNDPPNSCPADCITPGSGSSPEDKPITVPQDLPHDQACSIAEGAGSEEYGSCTECLGLEGAYVWTEFGCIKADSHGATVAFLRIAVGIITGIAIFRLIQAGLLMGSGNPENVKEAQGIAIAAISAIVFLGACVILLEFTGVRLIGFGDLGKYYATT